MSQKGRTLFMAMTLANANRFLAECPAIVIICRLSVVSRLSVRQVYFDKTEDHAVKFSLKCSLMP